MPNTNASAHTYTQRKRLYYVTVKRTKRTHRAQPISFTASQSVTDIAGEQTFVLYFVCFESLVVASFRANGNPVVHLQHQHQQQIRVQKFQNISQKNLLQLISPPNRVNFHMFA